MSTIGTTIQIVNQDTGLAFSLPFYTRVTASPGFSVSEIAVGSIEEMVFSEYPSPRNIALRLLSGGDVQVGTSTGVYPFILSGVGDSMLLCLNSGNLGEITTVTSSADVGHSLSGKYFELYDNAGLVRVWFNLASAIASGSFTFGNPEFGDDVRVNGTTITLGSGTFTIAEVTAAINALASVSATHNGTVISILAASPGVAGNSITLASTVAMAGSLVRSGPTLTDGADASTAPSPGGGRLIPVVIARNATATVVATAATAAIDADIKFLATSTGAVITITDTEIGSRTNATAGTTGWAVPVETRAGSNNAPIYLKSASTSQLMVAVAPK
jgi:hypothetical protein